ncbi:sterol desaturase family protein [Acidaminobacter sp. JC074]|uniref:sterol desaturase family protein n=1 Tax=Acidaminobacter sp. JC074 TaxID=2530199 RepID=UPI001F10AF82|nr:sterol desaturase family protein [Acidaminobacter sp. JC074]MCH4891395.1 sterol desaturase family protein [Acidaminobacter sp. JC074]
MTLLRSISFVSVLMICSGLQFIIPCRKFESDRYKYMISNLVLVGFNNIILTFIPLIPFTAGIYAVDNKLGLFQIVKVPFVLEFILSLLILDVVIYFQHRLFHKVDFLWKLHAMHHIDPMLDTTSGLRFHPLEIIISNFIKVATILVFGITPLAVVSFEIALNLLAMFNHSNIKINKKLEHKINKILITPALHTIHHSKIKNETNSNFGFSVPWWDKLFNTFTAEGKYPQEKIHIGTLPMPGKTYQLFPGMLIYPFKKF